MLSDRDTDTVRLIRIERKINSIGNILRAGLCFALGYAAYKLVADDLGLGRMFGGVAFLVAFAGFGHYTRKEYDDGP